MARSLQTSGLAVALVSSVAFALSGPLAKPLLDTGWSPGAAALLRIGGAALALALPCLLLLRTTGARILSANWRYLGGYAALAVAGTQIGFFSAIQTLPVAVALLIEYTGPVLVVGWLWWRRGQRPTGATVAGGALAMVGLVLILDPTSTSSALDLRGIAWAAFAAVCLAGYFLLSGHIHEDLPPLLVVGVGMVGGWILLAVAAAVGLLAVQTSTDPVTLGGTQLPWWAVAAALVLIATVFAYLTGIAAARRLGARLASFVSLMELVMATVLSAVLLSQTPGPREILGGVVILAGLVLVRLGEPEPESPLPIEEKCVAA